jgi:hypothetical protein
LTVPRFTAPDISSAKFGDDVVFKPSAVSSHTFPTPIQQIEISKSDPLCSQGVLILLHREIAVTGTMAIDVGVAVRTYGSTELFKLNTWSECNPHYKLTDLATLSRAEMGDEAMVDMKHVRSSHDVLSVGDRGSVYQWHISNGVKSTSALNILVLKLGFNANFTIFLGRSSIRMAESRPQLWTIVVFGDSLLIPALPFISLCPATM